MDDTDTRRDSPRAGNHGAVRSNPADGGTKPNANHESSAGAPAGVIDDPFAHLTPAERFTRALERRDAVILRLSQGSKRSSKRSFDHGG